MSCSVPSSQNTAGLVSKKKKIGRRGRKNPKRTPDTKVREVCVDEFDSDAVPALSIESIHCSSSARACSSTTYYIVARAASKASAHQEKVLRKGRHHAQSSSVANS